MTTGLLAVESRLPQKEINCSVRESPLLDGAHSLIAWEFVLVLSFDKFEITGLI